MFNHDDRDTLYRIERKMDQIIRMQLSWGLMELHAMSDIDDKVAGILDLANQESTDIESLGHIIGGLQAQVNAQLSQSSVSPTTVASINQIFATMQANKAKAMAAINNDGPGVGAVGNAAGTASTESAAVALTGAKTGATGATGDADLSDQTNTNQTAQPTSPSGSPIQSNSSDQGDGASGASGASGATGVDDGATGASGAT